LKLFSQARYFEKNFGYRRCVVQGLVQVKVREAIPFLIELIPTLKGIVQFDVIMHLTRATGQNLRDDVAMWRAWWARQAAGEPLKESPPPPAELYGKFGSFYGLPICAKRVVFVVDTSGSMNGPKLDAAKRELIATIKELPQEVAFGLVIFSNSIRIWQGELVPATTQMKELAIKTVQSQEARGDTSTYDALEAAFTLDPEAIYLLSDGAPTSGKIVAPNEIVGTIAAFNKLRRVSIFTVGIDTNDTTAVMFARFMRGLAEANWGEYQAVKG
jgi:uncharacterized protein YegL